MPEFLVHEMNSYSLENGIETSETALIRVDREVKKSMPHEQSTNITSHANSHLHDAMESISRISISQLARR